MAAEATGALGTESELLPQAFVAAHVELRGGELVWSPVHDPGPIRTSARHVLWEAEQAVARASAVDRSGMLDRFVRLTDEQGVLDFAARYGPLRLCEHGYPAPHSIELGEEARLLPLTQYRSDRCPPALRERVTDWLAYSAWAEQMLVVAAEIDRSDDLRDGALRVWLGDHLGFWIQASELRPKVTFKTTEVPTLGFEGFGLFANLAMQMLMAVTHSSDIAHCDSCGRPYLPRRKPASGRPRYCTRQACQRMAARIRKRRQRRHDSTPAT